MLACASPPVYRRLQEAAVPETTRRHCVGVFQSWLMACFKTLSLEEILKMLAVCIRDKKMAQVVFSPCRSTMRIDDDRSHRAALSMILVSDSRLPGASGL